MKHIVVCILLLLFSIPGKTQEPDTVYYSAITKSKIVGGQKIWKSGPGEYHVSYQYNDRGRGDSTLTTIRLNESGNTSWLLTSGIDYYKNAYTEQFELKGDSAVWKINTDRKSAKFSNQLYNVSSGGPATAALSFSWILKQPGKKTAILPEGYMHLSDPMTKTISLNGKEQTLRLFALYADPSPTPGYIWMTDDMQFFASVSPWFTIIKKGFETWADSLFTLQEMASTDYYGPQLKDNSKQIPGHLWLTHANLFSSIDAKVQKDKTIELKDGKISAIYPGSKSVPAGDSVTDCTGKFIMPGLWDMHGHYSKEEGVMYLAGGVTHVRDMGNDKIVLTWRRQIFNNQLLGPDISYVSGFIDKEDPFQGPTGAIIKSLEEGLKAVDEYHRLGYGQIKLYSAIKPEWVKPLATRAHSYGMRVCGHIPAYMTAEQAINYGYDEITHMNFIFLNFMGDTIDTRTPRRFSKVGEEGGRLDLQSAPVQRFISLMKSRHISLDATMNVWQGMFEEFNGDTVGYLKPVATWVPDSWQQYLTVKSQYGSNDQKQNYKSAYINMLKMIKLLDDNGILLVAGTDGGDANALHHELEQYVRAGISPAKVIQIATYNAALDCSLQNVYGQILPGRVADLLIIDGNPSENISDIRKIRTVIKNGRIYQPKQLLQSQGWTYYY
jgi:Amidohydrolase family